MQSMKNTETVKYELMVIIDSKLGEDATKKRLERTRKLISSLKGEIFFEDLWGERNLGYPIKGHTEGYYAVMSFMISPEHIKEIDETLTLEPEVVRFLITKIPLAYEPKTLEEMNAVAAIDRAAREEKKAKAK